MLPGNVLSSVFYPAPFLPPRELRGDDDLLLDRELGGVALGDATQGRQVKVWTAEGVDNVNGVDVDVVLSAPGVTPTIILTRPKADLIDFGFTFDHAMNLFLVYNVASVVSYYWWDTLVEAYVTSTLPSGSYSARCSMDDKRALQNASSDIIMAYIREGNLYFRAQRDRYTIEYLLYNEAGARFLTQIGMNRVNRFQFLFKTT